jgi:hypothetical protein
MTDEELDTALRGLERFNDAQVEAFDLGSSESDLMEDLMSTSLLTPALADESHPVVPLRRRRRTHRAAMAAIAIAAASVLVVGGASLLRNSGSSAYAAEAVRVAEANERLLVTLPGWKVIRADEFTVTKGEMTFSDGVHELGLFWYDTKDYQYYLDDRADQTKQVPAIVRGRKAVTFVHEGSTDLTTIVEPLGANFLEIRGDLESAQAYQDVMSALVPVSVDTWLAALPASVVKPGDRSAVVQAVLQGIPLPAGFDPVSLKTKAAVSDRYQLGAQVMSAVACGWFDQWFTAMDSGDNAGTLAAQNALRSLPTWPISREMQPQGDTGMVILSLADAASTGSLEAGSGPHKPTRNEIGQSIGCTWALDSPQTVPH